MTEPTGKETVAEFKRRLNKTRKVEKDETVRLLNHFMENRFLVCF